MFIISVSYGFLFEKLLTLIGEIRKAYRVGENIKTNHYEKLKKTFKT